MMNNPQNYRKNTHNTEKLIFISLTFVFAFNTGLFNNFFKKFGEERE